MTDFKALRKERHVCFFLFACMLLSCLLFAEGILLFAFDLDGRWAVGLVALFGTTLCGGLVPFSYKDWQDARINEVTAGFFIDKGK